MSSGRWTAQARRRQQALMTIAQVNTNTVSITWTVDQSWSARRFVRMLNDLFDTALIDGEDYVNLLMWWPFRPQVASVRV